MMGGDIDVGAISLAKGADLIHGILTGKDFFDGIMDEILKQGYS